MDYLHPDDLRRLSKDEKAFRELNSLLQSWLAIATSGPGKEHWASFLSASHDLVLEIDRDSKVIAVHSTGELTKKKQFLGRKLKFFLPIQFTHAIEEILISVFENEEVRKLFIGDLNRSPYLILSPIRQGGVVESVLAIFPAAKLKLGLKKGISESERKYRYLFEHANDSIIVADPETHMIVEANEMAAKKLGYSVEQLVGMRVEEITADEAQNNLFEIRKNLFTKGHAIFETVHRHKDGTWLPVEVSSRRISLDGKTLFLSFVRDISERKRAEELLVRKGNELNSFVYRTSHDLKGPIATIRGLLMVAENELKDATSLYYLDLLKKAAIRLDNNLTDLIEITTVNRQKLSFTQLDINELVTEVLHELSTQFDLNTFQLSVKIDQSEKLLSDRRLVKSILFHLMSNGMKYSQDFRKDPTLSIRARNENKKVWIEIEDNGPGIPNHAREKIFDMFFRLTSNVQGTGLGLTIVRNTILKLGGAISVQGEEGKGTLFCVHLPNQHPALSTEKENVDG